jgi:hypothetical protein
VVSVRRKQRGQARPAHSTHHRCPGSDERPRSHQVCSSRLRWRTYRARPGWTGQPTTRRAGSAPTDRARATGAALCELARHDGLIADAPSPGRVGRLLAGTLAVPEGITNPPTDELLEHTVDPAFARIARWWARRLGEPHPTRGSRLLVSASAFTGTPEPDDTVKHSSTAGIRGSPSPRGRQAHTARRNVHEDHPHIKQMSAFPRAAGQGTQAGASRRGPRRANRAACR